MAIAIYSRKSRITGKGESIENQIELCRQHINIHFPDCPESEIFIYEDEGFSGGNTKRPQFIRMMADAKDGVFTAIVCYRLDRISRNIGDFAKLIEELNDLNVSFISIKEQFDTSSPMGRAMMYISSVFSQLERETIAERIRDNMHELAKTGRWLGGTTPTGYSSTEVKTISVDGKTRKSCMLQIVPDEVKRVEIIFEKFLGTRSLTQTETFLINNGYRTKSDRLYTRFAIKNILTNPVYIIADNRALDYLRENDTEVFSDDSKFDGIHGIMAYHRTIQKAGRAHQIRPMSEWIVAVGKHEGIINSEDWIQAQKLLDQNRDKNYRKPRSHTALLSGLLRCGNCGDYMRPKLTKRINGDGDQIYTYLCSLKEKSKCQSCNIKNVNGNTLDKAVCEEIKRLSEDSSEFIRQLESGKKKLAESRDEYDSNLEQLRTLLAETEADIRALVDSLKRVSGTSAEQYVVLRIDELHEKGNSIRRQITELESLTAKHELSDIEFDLILDMLASFANTFDEMAFEQKCAALRCFVKKVVWDGKNVHLYLFGSDDSGGIDLSPDNPAPFDGDDLSPLGEDSIFNTLGSVCS